MAELRHFSSNVIRSFEVVCDGRGEEKPAKLLLSSRKDPDLVRFEEQLNSIYGRMDYAQANLVPAYLRELPAKWRGLPIFTQCGKSRRIGIDKSGGSNSKTNVVPCGAGVASG